MSEQSLRQWALEEQAYLWNDFDSALDRAANGAWSMGSEVTAYRLVGCARHVGVLPRGEVPWSLDQGGVYDLLMQLAGIPVQHRSVAEHLETVSVMREYGHPEDLRRRYAATLVALREAWPRIEAGE